MKFTFNWTSAISSCNTIPVLYLRKESDSRHLYSYIFTWLDLITLTELHLLGRGSIIFIPTSEKLRNKDLWIIQGQKVSDK